MRRTALAHHRGAPMINDIDIGAVEVFSTHLNRTVWLVLTPYDAVALKKWLQSGHDYMTPVLTAAEANMLSEVSEADARAALSDFGKVQPWVIGSRLRRRPDPTNTKRWRCAHPTWWQVWWPWREEEE